jgi:hypothetical protein
MRHAARDNPHVVAWRNPRTGALEADQFNSLAEARTAMNAYALRRPFNTYMIFALLESAPATQAWPGDQEVLYARLRQTDQRPASGDLPVDPQTGQEGLTNTKAPPVEHVARPVAKHGFFTSPGGSTRPRR